MVQNLLVGAKLSEYHTGYRAFTRQVLETLPLLENSDDFVFDNQMLAQILVAGFGIGEVSCPTKYFAEASSINFRRSVRYGLGVLGTSLQVRCSATALPLRNFRRERPAARPTAPPWARAFAGATRVAHRLSRRWRRRPDLNRG